MVGFAKVFGSILDSSVWQESKETKLVWITLMVMADRRGDVFASIPGLANRAGVTVAESEAAIDIFLSPDKYSRTKEFDGRRIEEIDGGWRILNHEKFRRLLSQEERKEYKALKQKEYRERQKESPQLSTTVHNCPRVDNVDTVQSTESRVPEERVQEKTNPTTTSQQKAYDTRTSESTNPEVVVESKISKVVFLEIAKRLEIPESFAEAIWLEQAAIGWKDADGKNIVSPGMFLQSAWRREQARSSQGQDPGLREPWKIEADIKRVKAEIQNLQNNPLSRNNMHGFTDSKEEHRNRYESEWLETVAKCYDEAKEKLPEQVAQLGVLLESEREALSGNASAIAEFEKPEYRLIRFADEFDGAPDFETWDKDFNKPNHWRDPKGLTPEAITEMKLLRQSVNRLEGELREGLI